MAIGRTGRAAAALVAAAALAGGCAVTAEHRSERPPADRAADIAATRTMFLTLDDLPAGWQAGIVDDRDDGVTPLVDTVLADCLGRDLDDLRPDLPEATSPTFASRGGSE